MKKITIGYWHSPIPEIKYRHNQEMTYTTRNINAIIKHVLAANCSVMIKNSNDGNILVWIDRYRFGQR